MKQDTINTKLEVQRVEWDFLEDFDDFSLVIVANEHWGVWLVEVQGVLEE